MTSWGAATKATFKNALFKRILNSYSFQLLIFFLFFIFSIFFFHFVKNCTWFTSTWFHRFTIFIVGEDRCFVSKFSCHFLAKNTLDLILSVYGSLGSLALRIDLDILSLVVHNSIDFGLHVFGLSLIWRTIKMEFLGNHTKIVFHLVMVSFGLFVNVPYWGMIIFGRANRLRVNVFVNRKISRSFGVHPIFSRRRNHWSNGLRLLIILLYNFDSICKIHLFSLIALSRTQGLPPSIIGFLGIIISFRSCILHIIIGFSFFDPLYAHWKVLCLMQRKTNPFHVGCC